MGEDKIMSNNWNDVKQYPLAIQADDESFEEIEVLHNNYLIMLAIVTHSKHSHASLAGKKVWEYYIARIDGEGDLVDIDDNDIGISYNEIHFWKELPEPPYKIINKEPT